MNFVINYFFKYKKKFNF